MEQTCEDIDEMFSNLLGEMDLLTQSLGVDTVQPPSPKVSNDEFSFTVGFKDLNESLSALEDKDLDALMADLVADINDVEQRTLQAQKTSSNQQSTVTQPSINWGNDIHFKPAVCVTVAGQCEDDLPPPPPDPNLELPPPPPPPPEPLTQEEQEAQAKADKIKLALEKLKEAKVRKLVVKVHMNDNSTKSLMVDERQVTRDVLDNLFEKTHCDCNVDWCLYEMYPELQIERFFEDHENVIEVLSSWTRDTENKILFLEKSEKYALFKNPQNFYLASKEKNESKEMNDKNKEALLEESFCGTSVVVPELEGALYLKEDGKKSWKRRYFLLRASGIYYVPKGKTKTSRDLACFLQFENMNVYYGSQHKVKYKAPTDHCFVLKHPQIQKESQYIKYLCCDDQATLHQWVTGIRIAKYGKTLYDNYKCAVKRAGLSRQANQGTVKSAAPAGPSSAGAVQSNGQIPQTLHHSSLESPETQKKMDTPEVQAKSNTASVPGLAQPLLRPQKHQGKRNTLQPPPPPERRSSAIAASPVLPSKVQRGSGVYLMDPDTFPAPPPTLQIDFPPPPPADFCEPPPDFVPPPPPASSSSNGDLPLPPPPPPVFTKPPPPAKKPAPLPPKRLESTGQAGEPQPAAPLSTGGGGRQPDFMSDLMKALEKKRGSSS
ncbi:amyloid beta A4 precursor protein-binding family B member 1-interacting protein isoform X1 [Melanerpes formicivorus]|uniref:amyloid beta A4 precursor protein-binding family B member 1-interacting protein isoform X1 n=1 Tax=Melanerpes formicivorus TaxID=211600 RepID=UPI00358E1B04